MSKKKTTIRFSIPIFTENRNWEHEFTTTVELPLWIPYENRKEVADEELEDENWQPPACELVREKLLRRELKKAPMGTLWRGFVETVNIVDGAEVWWLGS